MEFDRTIIRGFLMALLSVSGGFVRSGFSQSEAPQLPHQSAMVLSGNGMMGQSTAAGVQSPFLGSVPESSVTSEEIQLSLTDAIQRGLKNNLGQLLSAQGKRAAVGEQWQARSALLPNVNTKTAEMVQEINLAAFGFSGFPGIENTIVGPFSIFDARVYASQSVFNWSAISNARAGSENAKAASLSYDNARDVVVAVSASLYLQAIAGASRIEASQSQVNTAKALYQQALDFKQSGVVPAIEVLRAQVELQAQEQQLIFYQNEFEKQKLNLARAIGLPERQAFRLSDQIPYSPLPPMTLEEALDRAYHSRSDYQSSLASVRASEFAKKAAEGERLPTVSVDADFGDIGNRIGSSHETFSTAASLRIPVFQGGRIHGEVMQADALLQQRKAQLEDLRSRIEHELRTAFLDLKSLGDRVSVAQSTLSLAEQQMEQAKDRFAAGVTGNIEVVQAQEALATAHENLIASTYSYNLAKTALAQALGGAERSYKQFLLGERVNMGNTVQSPPMEAAPDKSLRKGESGTEPRPRSRRMPLLIGLLVIVAIAAFFAWSYYSVRESTDDAQVEGHIHSISAKVGGTVIAVHIRENLSVDNGAKLIELDPKDYQVALEKAQADLAEAEAVYAGSKIDLPIVTTTTSSELSGAEAGVQEARANLSSTEKEVAAATARLNAAQARVRQVQANHTKAERDLDRMKQLVAKEEISQQQYDASVAESASLGAALESAQADVSAAEQGLQVAKSHVSRDQARLAKSEASARAASTGAQQINVTKSKSESAAARVQMAKAALDQAQLNLQYTTLYAPLAGEISKKSVEVGQNVQMGQPLFAIVPTEDVWVDANFKETQLRDIRPGQPVSISVDAYGGQKFKGHVESISAATGAKFSLLPPENATGNFVKVVQRVPVRILLDKGEDPEHRLRPGMSVVPTIYTK